MKYVACFVLVISALVCQETTVEYPVVILGGGVGALTAATYAARAGITPLVVEGGSPGGALMQSHSVQNWPGEFDISGADLVAKMRAQALENGAILVSEEVVQVNFKTYPFIVKVASIYDRDQVREIKARSCIIAMGSTPNRLGVVGEEKYWASGVHTCAVCDGSLYKDKVVAVVGGGDSSVTEAHYLARKAKKVLVLVRKGAFRGKEIKRRQELLALSNVEVLYYTTVEKLQGNGEKLTGLLLKDTRTEKTFERNVDGVFLAIGAMPNTKIFRDSLDLDPQGYIVLKKDQETSKKGVFAVGDIVDPLYKQAVAASRDGAIASLQAEVFLSQSQSIAHRGCIEITSFKQFQEELKDNACPVFVDVYATWCGPCHMLAPIFESASERLSGKAKFLKVNAEVVEELASRYQVRQLPTLLIFDENGELKGRKMGVQPIAQFFKSYNG